MRAHETYGVEQCKSECGHIALFGIVRCRLNRFNHQVHEGFSKQGILLRWHTDEYVCDHQICVDKCIEATLVK